MGSAIHLEYIRMVAEANPVGGGEEVVAFHRSLFLHHHGAEMERCQEQRRIREERLTHLAVRLRQTQERLAQEEKLVPVLEEGRPDTEPTAPWNLWDRAMFVVGVLAVLGLLVFGVFNISFNLLESGIATFTEHPLRAYLWAALLPVGALAVKVGWDFLESRRARSIYVWTCLATGVLAVFAWVAAYASVYPSLSQTAEDQIASLRLHEPVEGTVAPGVKRVDMVLVAAQAVAEICLSAALGMYLTQLYARHRPVRLARNPTFMQLEAEQRQLESGVAEERLALAAARGDSARLENQLSVFITYARSLFDKETALRRDRGQQKRELLEEIASEFRARLDAVGRDGDVPRNGDVNGVSPLTEGAR